jgi:TatD DNase family protein
VAGAKAIVCIGESIDAAAKSARLAALYPGFVFSTAGIHPHDAATFDRARDVPALRSLIAAGAVALGECGLDYHYDNSPRKSQLEAFAEQIALAAELRVPVVVHTRDAEDDTRTLIGEARATGVIGVLHCYTGSHALAELALDAGWYVSFSGIVTFRKWTDDELLRLVPQGRLLVESDSPYLAPVPFRGKRNEPAWASHTLLKVAASRGESAGELGRATVANTVRLFGLALEAAS